LNAGKHIYCEWPLGRNVDEAERIADTARQAGVHHAIGLQGSAAPTTRRAIEVITSGPIEHLRSARVVSNTEGYAAQPQIRDG
jgi:predicted dehydrogenase